MKNKNKKIALLFAGGTTLTDKDISGSSVNRESEIAGWLAQLPELILMAKIEPIFICLGTEELKGVRLWQKVSQLIFEKQETFEGFVILTDLTEVLNLGIALSFALVNLNKPVILTSSQITKETVLLADWKEKQGKAYGGLGARANLINAVQIANLGLPAVALMFGNRIIRPTKARRIQTLGLNLFDSIDDKYLGKIDFGISLSEKIKPSTESMELKNQFEENIQIINWLIGNRLVKLSDNQAKGIIVRDLPNLQDLAGASGKVPILVYNRFLIDQRQKEKENIIVTNNLTWETAVVKFMWVLAQKENNAEAVMDKECCGEFIRH